MRKPKEKWVDIYFYSHPVDNSIRYIGSEKFGKEPIWLINNKLFKEWMGTLKADINIIDTVPHDDVHFWTEFYNDLFKQWGFSLIKNDFLKEVDDKRIRDLHKIKSLILNSPNEAESPKAPIRLQDFSESYQELEKLCATRRDSFLTEVLLLLHCLFINGIPWEICIGLTADKIQKGYVCVGNTILIFSEKITRYSSLDCKSSDFKIFREILKVCHGSQLKLFVIKYINAISTYFGYSHFTKGEFQKDFGRLKYWESGSSYSTTIFLIRLFRCKDRLELLIKLDLIPKLR